jgi:DNA repair exonuclease SbcCD ATPase subunit
VREHELHSMREIIPKREGEVARAKKTLSEMNKVLEEEAEQRKIREEKTKKMKDKQLWLEERLRKENEKNDRLQRGLARVAQQLNTLVMAQARPEARKILDINAWVEELGRLHDLVAPLINVNNTLDDQELDLAKLQQDTHNKQVIYLITYTYIHIVCI